jgi:hypothetical protein
MGVIEANGGLGEIENPFSEKVRNEWLSRTL